jgi:hypothetical protein
MFEREIISARGILAQLLRSWAKSGSVLAVQDRATHQKQQPAPCPDIIYSFYNIIRIPRVRRSSGTLWGAKARNNIGEYRDTNFQEIKIISAPPVPIFPEIILRVGAANA